MSIKSKQPHCREKGTILTRHVSEKEFLYTFLRKTEWKIGQPFNISYIENGAPVVFCLSETPPFRVVIGERYINYVTLIHRLLGDDIQGEMLSEQSRRLGLTIMAEFALRYGNTDYAVAGITKSLLGNKLWIPDNPDRLQLIGLPMTEAAIVSRFYAVAHEVGHLSGFENIFPDSFKDDKISRLVAEALKEILDIEHHDIFDRFHTSQEPCVNLGQLRIECAADSFATFSLYESILSWFRESDIEFSIHRYAHEFCRFLHSVAILSTGKSVVDVIPSKDQNGDAVIENLARSSVASSVRIKFQTEILNGMLSGSPDAFLLRGKTESWPDSVELLTANLTNLSNTVYNGFMLALDFFANSDPNDFWMQLESFRMECVARGCVELTPIGHARQFFEMAKRLESSSVLLNVFNHIMEDFRKPFTDSTLEGSTFYVILHEPAAGNVIRHPFCIFIDGRLSVFLFKAPGEAFDAFLLKARSIVQERGILTKTFISAPDENQLFTRIAEGFPANCNLNLIVEGTELFATALEFFMNIESCTADRIPYRNPI